MASHRLQDYGIPLDELDKPLEEYRTLNEFFTRRLRPGARPLCSPGWVGCSMDSDSLQCATLATGPLPSSQRPAGLSCCDWCAHPAARLHPAAQCRDDACLVQPADARMVAFSDVHAAQLLWIKGRGFTAQELLGMQEPLPGRQAIVVGRWAAGPAS